MKYRGIPKATMGNRVIVKAYRSGEEDENLPNFLLLRERAMFRVEYLRRIKKSRIFFPHPKNS